MSVLLSQWLQETFIVRLELFFNLLPAFGTFFPSTGLPHPFFFQLDMPCLDDVPGRLKGKGVECICLEECEGRAWEEKRKGIQ